MSILLHGDCLEELKGIDDNSVDFIFCDLPYGQTSCKWDTIIDWEPLWKELMRVKKLNTPLFFTTTTKFGVELINNAPKKCPFRYDLVWVKSAPAGFLSAKKMPMRKHEMIYCFYEKLPFYDLSSHKHKFIKDGTKSKEDNCYGVQKLEEKKSYDPPLPVSVVKEEMYDNGNRKGGFGGEQKGLGTIYQDPGLISSQEVHKKNGLKSLGYDPPLPVSVVKEQEGTIYGDLPTTDSYAESVGLGKKGHETRYDPPLPNSLLEIKSTRGKHSTEKPVALMEWLLKYFSKEGDTVLDPTMGSGSTGVACKNMNRNFIGIEKDPEIYEVAVNRIEN